ncbi:MAG: DUF2238 domain-containing protein [Planctomycetota bacterium]|nr:DUF2238 domain-containing protein [Planctomycetota bacterium]
MDASGHELGRIERQALIGLVMVAAVASGIAPVDRYTWGLELAIVVAVGAGLAWLRPPVTRGLAWLLVTYALVMLVGAHYTYGQAPPGDWLAGWLGLERNPYDRVGHVFQGLVPAYAVLVLAPGAGPDADLAGAEAAGEGGLWRALLRLQPGVVALAAALGTVALFEGLELVFAALAPAGADFVQAQGDPNDTAWDVAFAAGGSLLAVVPSWLRRTSLDASPRATGALSDRRPSP